MRKVWWFTGFAVAAAAVAAIWLARDAGRDAEQRLLAAPVYQVLKRHEPAVYARVLERFRDSQQGRATAAEFTNLASELISEAATRRLARASDQARLALMRDMLANLQRLRARHDDACFRYLYPEIAGGADVAAALTPEAQAHTLQLAGEVIRSAAEQPAPPVSPEHAAAKLGPVIDAVYARFGADTTLMSRVREPGVDRAKVCDIAIALYEKILALPPADAALVLGAVAGEPGVE